MKKLLIFLLFLSLQGFSQIVRTLPNVDNVADINKPVSTPQKAYIDQRLYTATSKTALTAFTDADIANYDGSIWERKAGNVASNGGSYAGTIVNVSSSYYWERKFEGFVNVTWFGTAGTGDVNDLPALNNAKDYLKSKGGGGYYMPKGIYRIDDHFYFDFSNVTIYGEGIGLTVIKVNAWVDGLRISDGYPAPTTILNNITIKDLSINGNRSGYTNGANDTYGNGLNINACDNVLVRNVKVFNAAEQGIVSTFWQVGGVQQNNLTIENSIVQSVNTNRIGIGVEGRGKNCTIRNNRVTEGGVYVGHPNGSGTDNGLCFITENICESSSNVGYGVRIEDNMYNVSITNNILKGFNTSIRASSTTPNPLKRFLISNNQCLEFSANAILVYPMQSSANDESSIISNKIQTDNATANKIAILTQGGSLISSNEIRGVISIGIKTFANSHISGNYINADGYSIQLAGNDNSAIGNRINADIDNGGTGNEIFSNFGYTFDRSTGFFLGTKRISATNDTPSNSEGNNGDIKFNQQGTSGSVVGFIKNGGVWLPFGSVGSYIMPTQLNSTATTISQLQSDFNDLLQKLKNSKLMN